MAIIDETYTLSNGIKMPKLGFGTYQLKAGENAYQATLDALKAGIRHIDSAIVYQNEKSVGQAIRDAEIPREAIFITSKVPPHIKNYQGTIRMFEKTLKNLGVDYLDLYIINAPGPFHDLDGDYDTGNIEVYQALETLYKEKRVRAIGVSQFKIKDIQNLIDHNTVVPHVNQISFFIGHTQAELVDFCMRHEIQIQAFSPLAKGYLFNNPKVQTIAKKYGVHPAQMALRYIIQKQAAPIPKALDKGHILTNTQLDFSITKDDIDTLDQITDDPREYNDPV